MVLYSSIPILLLKLAGSSQHPLIVRACLLWELSLVSFLCLHRWWHHFDVVWSAFLECLELDGIFILLVSFGLCLFTLEDQLGSGSYLAVQVFGILRCQIWPILKFACFQRVLTLLRSPWLLDTHSVRVVISTDCSVCTLELLFVFLMTPVRRKVFKHADGLSHISSVFLSFLNYFSEIACNLLSKGFDIGKLLYTCWLSLLLRRGRKRLLLLLSLLLFFLFLSRFFRLLLSFVHSSISFD